MCIGMRGGGTEAFVLVRKGHEFKKEMKIKNEHPQQRLINTALVVGTPWRRIHFLLTCTSHCSSK